MWPDITAAYHGVHRAAHLLDNKEGRSAEDLRCAYECLLAEIGSFALSEAEPSRASGTDLLRQASLQFVKVTESYGEGLFACYRVPDLPPTNNDLEPFFGSARYHERRVSGRKRASPGTVVRGPVRLAVAVATRQRCFSADELRPGDLASWRALRQDLEQRHETRRQQRQLRFACPPRSQGLSGKH